MALVAAEKKLGEAATSSPSNHRKEGLGENFKRLVTQGFHSKKDRLLKMVRAKVKFGPGIVFALCGLAVFIISTNILLKNPIYFARIIQVEDKAILDQPPDRQLNIRINGIEFGYRFPALLETIPPELQAELHAQDTDWKRILAINAWVRKKLSFGEPNIRYRYWRPQSALADAAKGEVFMCDFYARLAASLAQNIGVPSRVFWLEGHVVPSFYLAEENRWVMVDPALGYYYQEDGRPLSVTEIISRCNAGSDTPEIVVFGAEADGAPVVDNETVAGVNAVYTNGFTLLFDGESTQKGVRWMLTRERRFPVYLQYITANSQNLRLRKRILWLFSVGGFLTMAAGFLPTAGKKRRKSGKPLFCRRK